MPLPPLANSVKVAWIQELHGVELVSTMHMFYPGAGDVQALEGLGAVCIGAWADYMLSRQSYQLRLVGIQLRQLIPGAGVAVDASAGPDDTGTNFSDADNTVLACVASLRTAQAGRSYRGRMFVGGIPNNVVQNGLIEPNYRTDVALGVSNLIAAIRDQTTANPVIISYYANKVQRPTPVQTSITQVISATAYPGVLRSRQRRS